MWLEPSRHVPFRIVDDQSEHFGAELALVNGPFAYSICGGNVEGRWCSESGSVQRLLAITHSLCHTREIDR